MESLSPFLWRTCTSYNMPVYPGAQCVVADSVETHHGFIPIGGPNVHAQLVSLTFLRPQSGNVGEE